MPEQIELITRQMLLPMPEQTFLKKRMILSMPSQISQIEKQIKNIAVLWFLLRGTGGSS